MLVIKYFLYSVSVEGWRSVMVSIYFISGLLLANMDFLGLYVIQDIINIQKEKI